MFLRTRKGFTILELLIVIAVIAILVGIALPRFKGMRDEGNIARAKGEMRSLQTAIESYRIHAGSYPTALGNLNAASTVPNVIGNTLCYDPFAAANVNYGYNTNGSFYVVYSIGVNGSGTATIDNAGNVTAANNVVYVSNGSPGSGG